MNTDLVSVVIPTHNREKLLIRAVKSVLNQEYKNLEIIVVSDGSTDGTDDAMKRISLTDKRIKYISYSPAKGGNHARNIGIKESKGEYIAFLDDDDTWHENKIKDQLEVFRSDPNIGLVCTGFYSIYEGEEFKTPFIPRPLYDSSKEILLRNCIGSTTTVMVKRSDVFKAGLFDEDLGAQQDYDLWIRMCQITKIGVLKGYYVDYYNYPSANQISQYTNKYETAIKYIEEKYSKLLSELNNEEIAHRKRNQLLTIAKKAVRNGEAKYARKKLTEAKKYGLSADIAMIWLGTFISPRASRYIRHYIRKLKYMITK